MVLLLVLPDIGDDGCIISIGGVDGSGDSSRSLKNNAGYGNGDEDAGGVLMSRINGSGVSKLLCVDVWDMLK